VQNKQEYKIAWLGLIPLVGFFSGIILIWRGLFIYKDKKPVILGFLGVLFTLFIYGFLFYKTEYSESGAKDFEYFSTVRLNNLVKAIEFYKLRNNKYPDDLKQLQQSDSSIIIDDPLMFRGTKAKNTHFNYERTDTSYSIFSSGRDKIINTADDIYPGIK
jgi:hypothetical protein